MALHSWYVEKFLIAVDPGQEVQFGARTVHFT